MKRVKEIIQAAEGNRPSLEVRLARKIGGVVGETSFQLEHNIRRAGGVIYKAMNALSLFACWDGKYKPQGNFFDPASRRRITITAHDHPVRKGTIVLAPENHQLVLTVTNNGDDPTGETPFIISKNSPQLELGPAISHEHLQSQTEGIVCFRK